MLIERGFDARMALWLGADDSRLTTFFQALKKDSPAASTAAVERGVTFFDTADVYGDGRSEQGGSQDRCVERGERTTPGSHDGNPLRVTGTAESYAGRPAGLRR